MADSPYDPMERPSLVEDADGLQSHYCWLEDLTAEATTVADVAEPLHAALLLSADTPALAAVKLLEGRPQPYAFVLSGSSIIGAVTWRDFYKPEFTICVLALLLEVERVCIEAVLPDAEQAWQTLKPSRQAKAREVYALRHNRDSEDAPKHALLRCTTFIDKAALVQHHPAAERLGKGWLRDYFAEAERYRNHLAHSNEDEPPHRGPSLPTLIDNTERLLATLTPPSEPKLRLVE